MWDADTGTWREPKLPRDLAGAKPRYSYGQKRFELFFESDIDRAAYITAQRTRSTRDQDYLSFVANTTGMPLSAVRVHGQKVKAEIKRLAKEAAPGTLTIPPMFRAARPANPPESAQLDLFPEDTINPTSVKSAMSQVLAEETPVVSGADPATVRIKGALMSGLGLNPIESSSVENSDHQAVRELATGQKGESVEAKLEPLADPKVRIIIDPERTEEAKAVESRFREQVKEINQKREFYQKLSRDIEAQSATGTVPAVQQALDKAVQEGRAVSPEAAKALTRQAFRDRITALKEFRVKQEIEVEEEPVAPAEETAIERLIESGYPHILTAAKLRRLGVPVSVRTLSDQFLEESTQRIADQIAARFPVIPQEIPSGGASVPSYGPVRAVIDANGVGRFNNDPASMLGLIEQGAPVEVPVEALTSPTLNPAFRFARIGNKFVVSDIVVPESGGLVSALTSAEHALNLREDHTGLSALIRRVTDLREAREGEPDAPEGLVELLITSPFNPDEKITYDEAMSRVSTDEELNPFLPTLDSGDLTPALRETALIELKLRAQESLMNGEPVSLVAVGREVTGKYMEIQAARLKHQRETYVATIALDEASNLQNNPDFAAAEEISDPYTPYPQEALPQLPVRKISNMIKEMQSDAVAAMAADPALRRDVLEIIQSQVYASSSINFSKMTNKEAWGLFVQWMAQGNNRANSASLTFQRDLKSGKYEMGTAVRQALQIMSLSSQAIEGDPKTDPVYRGVINGRLRELLGQEPDSGQTDEFISSVQKAAGDLYLRSQPTSMTRAEVQAENLAAIAALGLETGNPDSILEALRRIIGVSDRAETDYDAHLVALARLLIQNPSFINDIAFTIDETGLEYAGRLRIQDDGTRAISININGYNPRGVADTLLHELTHAYVSGITRKPEAELTRQERSALRTLEGLIARVKDQFAYQSSDALSFTGGIYVSTAFDNHDPRVYEALENTDEFIAHFLTSTEFQQAVKVLSDPARAIGTPRSMFQRIVDAILGLFNIQRAQYPQFRKAFSAVLDLSHAAVFAGRPSTRREVDMTFDEFAALQEEGLSALKTIPARAKSFIANAVFPAAPVIVNTSPKRRLTADNLASKVAEEVSNSRNNGARLASALQGATGLDVAQQRRLDAVKEQYVEVARRLSPPEVEVVVDETLDGMAEVDAESGAMRVNPEAMIAFIESIVLHNGGEPVPVAEIIGVVLNEEHAHAASVAVISEAEINVLIDQLTEEDAMRTINDYGGGGKIEETREKMRRGFRDNNRVVKLQIVEEMLRQHAQRVIRGFTTEENVLFLAKNPGARPMVTRYFKSLLNRMGSNKTRKQFTPQLQAAITRIVAEIRGMEAGYVYHSNVMAFDPNNPTATLEQLRKQLGMNKSLEPYEEVEEPALASGLGPVTKGIYINDGTQSFTEQILNGEKTIETRSRNTLKSFLGQRVGIIRSGKGKSVVVGYATIGDEPIVYPDIESFRADEDKHLVKEGSKFDTKGKKYGYVLSDVVREPNPYPISKKGNRQYADIQPPTALGSGLGPVAEVDANYMAAVEAGDLETAQRMVDEATKAAGYPERGARAGVYRDGKPLLPSQRGLLGVGYYAVLDGTKEDVREFAGPITGPERDDKSLESRVDNIALDLGSNPLFFDSTRGINIYIRENGLTDAYNAWAAYQETINAAYKKIGEERPDSLEARRGSGFFRVSEEELAQAEKEMRDEGASEERIRERLEFEKGIKNYASTRPDASYLLESGFATAIIVDHSKSDGERDFKEVIVANPNQIKSAEPVTRDADGNVIPLSQRFDTTQESILRSGLAPKIAPFGEPSDLPVEFRPDLIDFDRYIRLLEIPVVEAGPYKRAGKFMSMFVGDTDPVILRLMRQRDNFIKSSGDVLDNFHADYRAALTKEFGEDIPPEDDEFWRYVQKATGTTDNVQVDPELEDSLHQQKVAAKIQADIDLRNANRGATEEQKKENGLARDAEIERIDEEFESRMTAARIAAVEVIKTERNQSLQYLKDNHNEIYKVVLNVRALTDSLSDAAKQAFGQHAADIGVKFDTNMGIYITRRYEMFSDPSYVGMILEADTQEAINIRMAAIEYMRDFYIGTTAKSIQAEAAAKGEPISTDAARAEAEAQYNAQAVGTQSLGEVMMIEFLRSFDTATGASDFGNAFELADAPASIVGRGQNGLSALVENLQGRSEIPEPLANLMGANNLKQDSIDNLLYSFGLVARIAAHQSFLNAVKAQGVEGGWLFDVDTYNKKRNEENFDPKLEYKKIAADKADDGLNPLAGMYTSPEIYEDLKIVFQQKTRSGNDAATQGVNKIMEHAHKLTGYSMGAKTLLSIGFYVRNMLSNVLFFGPAQGYNSFKLLKGSAAILIPGYQGGEYGAKAMLKRAISGTKAETDSYLSFLQGLGVFGNEIRSELMIRLMRGEETMTSVQEKLNELSKVINNKKTPASVAREAKNMAARVASAMDSFYKIGYFENERAVIEEAAETDPEDGKYRNMSASQRDKLAADIVTATAQSYDRAPPIIKKITSGGIGLLLAPFIRFTADIPRISANTMKQIRKELADSNSVIKRRGVKRLTGFTSVVGVFSMVVPTVLRTVVSGIGEEEDEALRESLPSYLKNHTFFYFKAGGKLRSLDLTYMNPFSVLVDPTMRFTEHLFRGEPIEGFEKLVTTAIFDPYLGDQIFAGAVFDVKENRDAATDKPIVEDTDPFALKTGKRLMYVLKEAYGPRTPAKVIEASKAAIEGGHGGGLDSPLGMILSEGLPVVPRVVDPARQFERSIYAMRGEYTRARQRYNELLQNDAMLPSEAADLYIDTRDNLLRINSRLHRTLEGFRKFMSDGDMYRALRKAKYGDRRVQLAFAGYGERYLPNPELAKRLMQTERGEKRLRALLAEAEKDDQFIPLPDAKRK